MASKEAIVPRKDSYPENEEGLEKSQSGCVQQNLIVTHLETMAQATKMVIFIHLLISLFIYLFI